MNVKTLLRVFIDRPEKKVIWERSTNYCEQLVMDFGQEMYDKGWKDAIENKSRIDRKIIPQGFVVIDGDGDHVYSAKDYYLCNDHINDIALFESVSKWVIRGFIFCEPGKNTAQKTQDIKK